MNTVPSPVFGVRPTFLQSLPRHSCTLAMKPRIALHRHLAKALVALVTASCAHRSPTFDSKPTRRPSGNVTNKKVTPDSPCIPFELWMSRQNGLRWTTCPRVNHCTGIPLRDTVWAFSWRYVPNTQRWCHGSLGTAEVRSMASIVSKIKGCL